MVVTGGVAGAGRGCPRRGPGSGAVPTPQSRCSGAATQSRVRAEPGLGTRVAPEAPGATLYPGRDPLSPAGAAEGRSRHRAPGPCCSPWLDLSRLTPDRLGLALRHVHLPQEPTAGPG